MIGVGRSARALSGDARRQTMSYSAPLMLLATFLTRCLSLSRVNASSERFLGVSNGILPKAGLIKPRKNTSAFEGDGKLQRGQSIGALSYEPENGSTR